jgi:hypothetical protein
MKLFPIAVSIPLLAAGVHAGGLVTAQVDSQARWIGHVDLQAFHESQIYQSLLEADEEHNIEKGLSDLFTTQGIDLFRDVRGVTAYGTGPADSDAVALIDTTANAEPALARWRDQLHATPLDIGGRACMQWKENGETSFSCLRAKPDTTDRLLVVSHSHEGLEHALDVLDGKRPSCTTQAPAEITLTMQPGTMVFFAASGIFDQANGLGLGKVGVKHDAHGKNDLQVAVSASGPESVIGRLAQGVRVEFGETGGRMFTTVQLRTQREEDAQKLQQIVQGLMALASFATEEPDVGATLGRWLAAVQITRQEQTLRLSFDYDLKTLIRELRALEALDKEKKSGESKDEQDEDK